MQVTSGNLAIITQAVNTKFIQMYLGQQPSWLNRIASIVPSSTGEEIYPWMAEIPQFREWIGDRIANDVATYDYRLKNKSFELTMQLDRDLVKNDQYGVWIQTIVPQIAANAARKKALLVRDAMRNGHLVNCYDGQHFFDASHPVNKFAGSGVTGTQRNYWTSKPLTADNYAEVRAGMMTLKDASGEIMGITPNILVVPPQLETTARLILNSDIIAVGSLGGLTAVGGQTNVLKGSAEPLVIQELSPDPTTWYLLDTTKGLNPFLWQDREELQLVSLVNPTDQPVYTRKKFQFLAEIQGAAGYTMWPLAAKAAALCRPKRRSGSAAAPSGGRATGASSKTTAARPPRCSGPPPRSSASCPSRSISSARRTAAWCSST